MSVDHSIPATSAATHVGAGVRTGVTLAELMVVVGLVALLLAILLPALAVARSKARAMACSSQLREIGRGISAYANDYDGFVPRDHTAWRPDRRPYWLAAIGPYITQDDRWDDAKEGTTLGQAFLREFSVFSCPAHPWAGEVPGTYAVNAFKFESQPRWDPDGPVKIGRVANPSGVLLVVEMPDQVGGRAMLDGHNGIMSPVYHDLFSPSHLPGGGASRMTDTRHNGASNGLFFDMSVRIMREGTVKLESFDDKVIQRSTHRVLTR